MGEPGLQGRRKNDLSAIADMILLQAFCSRADAGDGYGLSITAMLPDGAADPQSKTLPLRCSIPVP